MIRLEWSVVWHGVGVAMSLAALLYFTSPSPAPEQRAEQALHQRIVSKGWQLPHMRFVYARQLQAAGKAGHGRSLFHYKLIHADTIVQR